jgi:hypothetical protein
MLQKLIKVYEGDSIGRVTAGLIFVPIEYTGRLRSVRIKAPVSFGTAIFTGRLNGSILWIAGERIPITSGSSIGEKSGLDIAVAENDDFHIDLVQMPTGLLVSPITVTLEIEDGTFVDDDVLIEANGLANAAIATGTIAIAKDFKLKQITLSHDGRLRLYKTAAARTADVARPFGDRRYRGSEHKIICDVLLNSSTGLEWTMSPDALGGNGDDPVTSDVYWSLTNNSGGTEDMTADLLVVPQQT